MTSCGVRMSGRSAKRALCRAGRHRPDRLCGHVWSPTSWVAAENGTARWSGRMLSVYRHGVACALFFANAVLNVSPNLVRQSSILLLDRRSKVVEPCVRPSQRRNRCARRRHARGHSVAARFSVPRPERHAHYSFPAPGPATRRRTAGRHVRGRQAVFQAAAGHAARTHALHPPASFS